MKIFEILLSHSSRDKSILSPHTIRLDVLQKRMNAYVDKICNPSTSDKSREFLKDKLKDDYSELRDTIKKITETETSPNIKYEVYDRRTGKKVAGPYITLSRASNVVNKLDNEFGAYRYAHRPIKQVSEAIHKLPLTSEDFDSLKKVMENPIPAIIASIYINEIIDDDEFNNEIDILGESDPNRDVRPLIAEWIKRIMPDQMYRFRNDAPSMRQRRGSMSPIHGYDGGMYHAASDPITGDAFGRL